MMYHEKEYSELEKDISSILLFALQHNTGISKKVTELDTRTETCFMLTQGEKTVEVVIKEYKWT